MRRFGLTACIALTLFGAAKADSPAPAAERYPTSVFGPVNVLDESNPQYQASVNDLAAIAQLLAAARAKAQASKQAWTFPGFDYDKLDADLGRMQQQLNQVLLPRTLRLRYQRLVPDAAYFHPAAERDAAPTTSTNSLPAGAVSISPNDDPATKQDLPPPPPLKQ